MTNPDNSLHALDDIFVTDYRGQPVVCIGLSQTFYLADCTSLETRLRIGRCAEDYLQRYGDKIRKTQIECGKWRKPAKQSMGDFITNRSTPEKHLMILLSRAPALDELDWYTFDALADDRYGGAKLAFVTFSIPLADLEGAPRGAFQHMMKDWLALLRPVHAYGGFSTIFPIDGREARKLTYPLVMRFPGLDQDDPIWFDEENLDQGVKGAHWLVYLNPSHIAALGGLEALTTQLGEGFRIDPVAGGVLIQAGATPQLGDRNQNLRPRYYERLGKILAPIRVVISTNGYLDPEGEDPVLKTQDWLARFD